MGDVIGLEDELIWLPSHLLQEDSSDHPNSDKPTRKHHHRFYHRHHRRPIVSPAENAPLNWRVQPKQKNQSTNWKRNGDERMQAFFLASGPATSGTGVFLPTTASCPSKKKPACAPVLLPSRVVQALNLNVHSLGLQVSPRPGPFSYRFSQSNLYVRICVCMYMCMLVAVMTQMGKMVRGRKTEWKDPPENLERRISSAPLRWFFPRNGPTDSYIYTYTHTYNSYL
ncbi:PREDICTED: uncharacterized protein LOC104825998 isoform X1 [Tarenaya hassleriana]|uniref:uncharacterized protein LOC104825998 isoform X1 n=1 Tax=Tarenaya hassleriana TaxID=28532 RepID=UPI0008FD631F|nr:PREDICTED: uncharacterized protein LOC104825998 isoform X1 [Tarenaya hassleriana]